MIDRVNPVCQAYNNASFVGVDSSAYGGNGRLFMLVKQKKGHSAESY